MNRIVVLILFCTWYPVTAQEIIPLNTNSLILTPVEQENLRALLKEDAVARELYEPFVADARKYLDDEPHPIEVINYEGMLDTDSARIATVYSLSDMAKIITWYNATFGQADIDLTPNIRKFILAWSQTYIPTGNTINENKFVPLFWAYYLFRDEFSKGEQAMIESWMIDIAQHQLDRSRTPNNNWQVKRIKIIGLVGGITENQVMVDSALSWTKKYIDTSLFEDGTTIDLRTRDALHYHNSGLKALLTLCINLSIVDPGFNLYDYVGKNGGSIRKSVDYVIPYAMGEMEHEEWVNTKVELDRRRAAAGISKYQTGKLFDPQSSLELFELSCYYDPDHFAVMAHLLDQEVNHTMTWASMLNSAVVRD